MIITNMQTTTRNPWVPRLAAFAVALLLAASVVFWVLRWPVQDTGPVLPVAQASEDMPAASAAAISRLLGVLPSSVQAAVPAASSRFVLTGVVALGGGRGVALLSIDGKPARPYRAGSVLEAGWVLQSVASRSVTLGSNAQGSDAPGAAQLTLELPRRQP